MGNFATVTLPALPDRPLLTLTIQKVMLPDKLALYHSETTDTGPALSELIRIISSVNVETSVAVAVSVPRPFIESLPSGFKVELFAEFVQIGADDEAISTFERLGASYDPVAGIAYANIPPYAFTPIASVATHIIVGSYPKEEGAQPRSDITATNISPSSPVNANPNDAISLSADLEFSIPPPIFAPTVVTGTFGPRVHPVKGEPRFHFGVDLRANGVAVYPVLPGTVIKSGPQYTCDIWSVGKAGVTSFCKEGFGHRVVIDHSSKLTSVYAHLKLTSVYAHLEPTGLPTKGTEVDQLTRIGVADSTGELKGPHLHLEYRLDSMAVDPTLFIGVPNESAYLSGLSVIALVDGKAIESTRRPVNAARFGYRSSLDLAPLGLAPGSNNRLSLVVQNAGLEPGLGVELKGITLTIKSGAVVLKNYTSVATERIAQMVGQDKVILAELLQIQGCTESMTVEDCFAQNTGVATDTVITSPGDITGEGIPVMRLNGGPLEAPLKLVLNAVGSVNISGGVPWLFPGAGLVITAGGSVNASAESIAWNCNPDPQCPAWNTVHSHVTINASGPINFTASMSTFSVGRGPPIDITCSGPGPNNVQNLTGGTTSGC